MRDAVLVIPLTDEPKRIRARDDFEAIADRRAAALKEIEPTHQDQDGNHWLLVSYRMSTRAWAETLRRYARTRVREDDELVEDSPPEEGRLFDGSQHNAQAVERMLGLTRIEEPVEEGDERPRRQAVS